MILNQSQWIKGEKEGKIYSAIVAKNNNNNNNNNNNMTLFNEGNIIYWLPSSLQYGPP